MAGENQNPDGAMFYFDTNINAVASDISAGLSRINAKLKEPLDTAGLAANTAALGQLAARMTNEVNATIEKVKRNIAAGMNPVEALKTGYAEGFQAIPHVMANEMGRVSGSVANSAPVKQLAGVFSTGLVSQVREALARDMPAVFAQVKDVKFPAGRYKALMNAPAAYGKENDLEALYRNQIRAENLLRRDMQFGPESQQRASDMGYSKSYMAALQKRTVIETESEDGTTDFTFKPTDAIARLKDITRARQDAETTARRLAREESAANARAAREMGQLQTEAIALNRLYSERVRLATEVANAERLVGRGTPKDGPGFREDGKHYVQTRAGAAETQNVLQQRAIDEAAQKREAANEAAIQKQEALANRSADRLRQAQGVVNEGLTANRGALTAGPGEHYRVAGEGTELVTNPARVEALDKNYESIVEKSREFARQVSNGNRLMANWENVIPVGRYAVLGDEVFRVNRGLAEEVEHGVEYNRVIKQTEALLARQAQVQAVAEARSARGQAGVVGGFFNKLAGARGDQTLGTTIGGHIASAAQFTLGYGALFATQNAIRDTIGEYKDYQDSLTDLQVATRNSDVVTSAWVNTLGNAAREVGENVGASLDTAARAVRAFGDPMTETYDQLHAIGDAANEAANKLALISNKPLTDATGDLIAIGTSYGLQPDQFAQINDAIANAKRNLGGDPAQISQGLASIASSAKTAGFDPNEAANLISVVQGRLDETGLAAATRLTRIFQTTSGSTGKGLAAELGVDSNQSVQKQLDAYAKIYNAQGTTQAVKNRITSQLGGTANLRELLAMFENYNDLTKANERSANGAGAANSEYNRKLHSLAGTLKTISGDIRAIQVDLVRTDIAAPFGLAIRVVEPLLHLLDDMLKAFDTLPDKIRVILGLLADVAIASKVVAVVSAGRAGAAATAVGAAAPTGVGRMASTVNWATRARATAEERYIAVVTEATAAREAVETAEDGVIAGAAEKRAATEMIGVGRWTAGEGAGVGLAAGLRGGLARVLGLAANPYVLAGGALIGGGVLASKMIDSHTQSAGYTSTAADATSKAFGRIDGSASTLRAAATDLHSAAGEMRKADTNFLSRGNRDAAARGLQTQYRQLNDLAARAAAEERRNATTGHGFTFGDNGVVTTVSQLAEGLNVLAANGQTAVTQMRLLQKALKDVATPTQGQRYHPEAVAGEITGSVFKNLKTALPGQMLFNIENQMHPGRQDVTPHALLNADRNRAYNLLTSQNNAKAVDSAVQNEASRLGLREGQFLTEQDRTKLVHAAVNAISLKNVVGDRQKIKDRLMQIVSRSLDAGGGDQTTRQGLINGTGALSRHQVLGLLNPSADGSWKGLDALQQATEGAIPKGDDGTKLQQVRHRYVAMLKSLQSRLGGKQIPELTLAISNAENDLAETTISNLDRLRQHAQNQPGLSKFARRAIGRNYLQKEIEAAGTNTRQLLDIMNRADTTSLDLVQAALDRTARLAQQEAAFRTMEPTYNKPRMGPGGDQLPTTGPHGNVASTATPEAVKRARAFRRTRQLDIETKDKWGGDFAGPSLPNTKDKSASSAAKDDTTAEQLAALRARALVNPTDTVAAARADLAVSVANLHKASADLAKKKITQADYYQAVQDVTDKRQAYAQSEVDLAGAVANARAARTGGAIAAAKVQLQTAAAAMRLNARGTIGWWQGLQSFYEGQEAMRQAVMAYRNNLDKLHGDITNPVENARDQLRADERALRNARNKEDRASARVSIRQDDAGLQDAKFQQRLSDVQTSEDLGRMSFAKYMNYLDHEHERLTKIHHRTYQQQQELDTVDKAMKDALSSMDSQFNLGDINTNGLVYQMRRFKAQMAGHGNASASVPSGFRPGDIMQPGRGDYHQTVTISINGADTAMVKRTIDRYLRISGGQRNSLTRRKV